MRVLVSGAKGMLGQDICRTFRLAGHEIIATDREELDITKPEELAAFLESQRPNLLINTASYNLVDKVEDPNVYPLVLAVNAEGPGILAAACAARSIPIVHYSTDYVFAGDQPEGYREDDQPRPISRYGETKYLGEEAVRKAGGQWYIIRTSRIFGRPGATENSKPSFLSLMMKLAATEPELRIIDEEVGCPTFTSDLAEMTLQLINEGRPSGIYHCVNSGPGVTWYQFAEEFFQIAGVQTPRCAVSAAAFPPRPAKRPAQAVLLNTKLPATRPRAVALLDFFRLPKISVIIVSLDVRQILEDNLNSVFAAACRYPTEVIVVDNGSKDGTAAMVREKFPHVLLIQNDYNSGFAHACNQGLRLAKGEALILYNPDMKMRSGVLERAYETLTARSEIGALGVQLRREDGAIVRSVRRDPGFKDQLAILLKASHFFPTLLSHYLASDFDYSRSQEVEQITGSFFAFRRDVMDRFGLLDEKNFFVWFEEVDFCRRLRQSGLKIWYEADVYGTDLVGQTFAKQSVALKQARFSRSMVNYFFKWHGPWAAWPLWLLRPAAVVVGFLADLFKIRFRNPTAR